MWLGWDKQEIHTEHLCDSASVSVLCRRNLHTWLASFVLSTRCGKLTSFFELSGNMKKGS
jgi:hypothetical protein